MSLGELEARLDPTSFVRVHRSAIINLGRLERTEPAGGGRLLAHMSNGETIQVSRAGAQALRRFLI
jgi:two-component system LytT family response regulator